MFTDGSRKYVLGGLLGLTIIIEIDKRFTFGIDWYKYCKGVRLGYVAVHLVFTTLDKFVELNK